MGPVGRAPTRQHSSTCQPLASSPRPARLEPIAQGPSRSACAMVGALPSQWLFRVFKETRPSSVFGIAATDFVLASELNLGRYQISAVAGAATGERTVAVTNYVLPKFKVRVSTDKPRRFRGSRRRRSFLRPDQHEPIPRLSSDEWRGRRTRGQSSWAVSRVCVFHEHSRAIVVHMAAKYIYL